MFKKLLPFCFFLSVSALTQGQELSQKIDSLLDAHHQEHGFSGAVLIAKKGAVIYAGGRGRSGLERNADLNEHTRFPIASITKAFTAVLIMQLVEAGQLDLKESLAGLLPAVWAPKAKKITLHHLLTHTSGLDREPDEAYQQVLSPLEMIWQYAMEKPVAKPGKRFFYNNLDYILLGLIIEQKYQKPWAQVLQEKILTPLGMEDSGVLENGGTGAQLAAGYLTEERESADRAPTYAIGNYYAAAGMYSTAADLFKFDQALYSGQLLAPASLEKMYTSYPELGYVAYGNWVYHYPFLPARPRIVERRGGLPGFNHAFLRMIDEGRTIIILSNNDRFNPDTFGDETNFKEQLIRMIYRDGETAGKGIGKE